MHHFEGMHHFKGEAAPRRRPKRIAKKLAQRHGFAKYQIPPWIVAIDEQRRLRSAAVQGFPSFEAVMEQLGPLGDEDT